MFVKIIRDKMSPSYSSAIVVGAALQFSIINFNNEMLGLWLTVV